MLCLFCMSAEKKQNHPLSSVLQEMKERAPDVLDFIATISVPVVKEKENQFFNISETTLKTDFPFLDQMGFVKYHAFHSFLIYRRF